jgi:UDP-glucose 4-epimerase
MYSYQQQQRRTEITKQWILVTGGMGYIGSHLVVELLQMGYFVIIVDNLSNSNLFILEKIRKITNKTPMFYQFNCVNIQKLDTLFKTHWITHVFHLAGMKSVGESCLHPTSYYQTNIISTINLMSAMRINGCKKLIFSSSSTVYGSSVPPLNEDTSVTGNNIFSPYGKTKHVIEELLEDITRHDPEFHITSLRYFNPIGTHNSGLLGDNPNGTPDNIMPYLTRVAATTSGLHDYGDIYKKLSVFGCDYHTHDGTCIRDYIHIEDLITGHIHALVHLKSGYSVYNLGTGKGTSVIELINTFIDVTGISIPYKIENRRLGDADKVYCCREKAERELEWLPTKSLEDMCFDAWKYELQCHSLSTVPHMKKTDLMTRKTTVV